MLRVVQDVYEGPHSDVEFPLLVQKGPLDVLLDDPLRIYRLLVHEVDNVPNFGEKLDASTLVQSCWLHDPLIVFAVLLRH